MKTKWRFEVTYQNSKIKNINEKMHILFAEYEDVYSSDTIVFNSGEDVNIETVKSNLRSCYESEDLVIISLIGGKLE